MMEKKFSGAEQKLNFTGLKEIKGNKISIKKCILQKTAIE